MKLGLCTGIENAMIAADAGFDYIEAPLNAIAALPEKDFEVLCAASRPLPILKTNCFLPGDMVIVGEKTSMDDLRTYLPLALSRAARLGVKIAVFGSGASRSVPSGFPFDEAWRQLRASLSLAAEYAEHYNITIALEPLRREECNLLNLVSEVCLMSSLIHHPRIAVLGDTFHMLSVHEPWEALKHAGGKLRHLHISRALPDLSERIFPTPEDAEDYGELFSLLHDMQYDGDISIEASTSDLRHDAARAAVCLRQRLRENGWT